MYFNGKYTSHLHLIPYYFIMLVITHHISIIYTTYVHLNVFSIKEYINKPIVGFVDDIKQ